MAAGRPTSGSLAGRQPRTGQRLRSDNGKTAHLCSHAKLMVGQAGQQQVAGGPAQVPGLGGRR